MASPLPLDVNGLQSFTFHCDVALAAVMEVMGAASLWTTEHTTDCRRETGEGLGSLVDVIKLLN